LGRTRLLVKWKGIVRLLLRPVRQVRQSPPRMFPAMPLVLPFTRLRPSEMQLNRLMPSRPFRKSVIGNMTAYASFNSAGQV
jgi:hypothetical protein